MSDRRPSSRPASEPDGGHAQPIGHRAPGSKVAAVRPSFDARARYAVAPQRRTASSDRGRQTRLLGQIGRPPIDEPLRSPALPLLGLRVLLALIDRARFPGRAALSTNRRVYREDDLRNATSSERGISCADSKRTWYGM